jgi:prevent-host-death family protein
MWPDVAMKQVKIAELKNQLSAHLRSVERGAEIEITDRNRPIARLVPIPAPGAVQLRPPLRRTGALRTKRYPPAGWPVSSLELLLEERRKR